MAASDVGAESPHAVGRRVPIAAVVLRNATLRTASSARRTRGEHTCVPLCEEAVRARSCPLVVYLANSHSAAPSAQRQRPKLNNKVFGPTLTVTGVNNKNNNNSGAQT